ncbi:MAG: hypothetical protein NDI61_13620, partial [Bdellovibrionaceae bacterium]|nr:hypothetical protein [Pseudobdellovibrionaceae bacterium]
MSSVRSYLAAIGMGVILAASSSSSAEELDIYQDPAGAETPESPPATAPKPATGEPSLRGPEGIEFQPIALDTSIACNATLMKGSRRFQDTIFVFPRVLISTNPKGERLFEVSRLAQNRFLVRFSVYFPRTDQDIRIDESDVGASLRRCNLDEVRRAVNSSGGSNIRTVSRVPISAIGVQVDGIKKSFMLGGGDASMFNYQDSGHVVEFEVSDRAALESLLARVQSEIGLGIHVAMRFNARTADGGATITVDLKNLAGRLGAKLRGRKWIAEADLRAQLEQAVKQMRVIVDTESGTGTAHEALIQQLMDLVVSVAYVDADLIPMTEECIRYGNCLASRSGGGWGQRDREDEDEDETGGSSDPNVPPPAPAKIKVAALLDYLNKKGSYRFEYNNVGPSETFVYRTSVYFKGEVGDPDLRRYQVATGEKRVTAHRLESGQLTSLAVPEVRRQKLSYPKTTRYFSSGEIRELGLHRHFEILRNENLVLQDVNGPDGVVARHVVSKRRKDVEYLVWGQVEVGESVEGTSLLELDPTLKALEQAPLLISFDLLGNRKFRLAELAQDNAFWEGRFDEVGGRILFRAKQDLGQMTVRNISEELMQDTVVRWLFQEQRQTGRGVLATQTRNEIRK